jgi:hypothetical protein
MKKGRFLWSAHRITEKQKAGKARNIKEKQLKNSRNTVSKQLVALRSSASDNQHFKLVQRDSKTPKNCGFSGFFYFTSSISHLLFQFVCFWQDLNCSDPVFLD